MSRIEKALEKASQLRQKVSTQPDDKYDDIAIESSIDTFPVQDKPISVSNPILVVATDPTSHISEEYQKLKSALLALSSKGEFSNLLMITSAIPGEGKSVTAINLALCLAKEIDNTVLLIDADLRKPSVGAYLGIDAKSGLTDILEGQASVEEALFHTGIGRLVVMPAGKVASNPVELFSSNRMAQLLQELKHRYPDRFIIIDTPPVLPFAETRTLSRLVDGVVLVVKERLTRQANITEALSALEGARILGAVYNEAEIPTSDIHYGHYYGVYRYNQTPSRLNKGSVQENP